MKVVAQVGWWCAGGPVRQTGSWLSHCVVSHSKGLCDGCVHPTGLSIIRSGPHSLHCQHASNGTTIHHAAGGRKTSESGGVWCHGGGLSRSRSAPRWPAARRLAAPTANTASIRWIPIQHGGEPDSAWAGNVASDWGDNLISSHRRGSTGVPPAHRSL